VFKMKVDEFIDDIREGRTFGPLRAGRSWPRMAISIVSRLVVPVFDRCC
jgi:hypothetical protein